MKSRVPLSFSAASIQPLLRQKNHSLPLRRLFRARIGVLQGQERHPVAKFDSAQKIEEQLSKGAIWIRRAGHSRL